MRISVEGGVGDLARDLISIPVPAKRKMVEVVARNTEAGWAIARRFAKESSGPHGKNYFKRVTWESVSPLEGEYGPTGNVVENAVGAGWRDGPSNTDLPRSADLQGPKFAKDAGDILDQAFWP